MENFTGLYLKNVVIWSLYEKEINDTKINVDAKWHVSLI